MKGSLTTEVHWKIGKVAEVIRQNNFNIQYFPNVFSIFPNPNSNFNCTPVVLYKHPNKRPCRSSTANCSKYLIPGFFLHFNNFPSYLKWLSATSFTSYVFEGAMHAIYGFNRAKMVGAGGGSQ